MKKFMAWASISLSMFFVVLYFSGQSMVTPVSSYAMGLIIGVCVIYTKS
jgi:hypothetical protein